MSVIVESINLVYIVHTQASATDASVESVCELNDISKSRYTKSLSVVSNIRKYTDNQRAIKAAHKALSYKPKPKSKSVDKFLSKRQKLDSLPRMRYAPRNKQLLTDNLGRRKKIIKYVGQVVRVKIISNNYAEIVDDRSGENCGIVNRKDLLPYNTQFQTLKDRHTNIVEKPRFEINEEIEEKAKIIKQRREKQRQIEAALRRREKEEKTKRKEDRQLVLGDLSEVLE